MNYKKQIRIFLIHDDESFKTWANMIPRPTYVVKIPNQCLAKSSLIPAIRFIDGMPDKTGFPSEDTLVQLYWKYGCKSGLIFNSKGEIVMDRKLGGKFGGKGEFIRKIERSDYIMDIAASFAVLSENDQLEVKKAICSGLINVSRRYRSFFVCASVTDIRKYSNAVHLAAKAMYDCDVEDKHFDDNECWYHSPECRKRYLRLAEVALQRR